MNNLFAPRTLHLFAMAPINPQRQRMHKRATDRIVITPAAKPSTQKIVKSSVTKISSPFLQRNIRATIADKKSSPIHRISVYLRKYQEEKWANDITQSTRNKFDELLMNCDDAEANIERGDEKSRSRYERKTRMIEMSFKKIQPLIDSELEKARKQRVREGNTGRLVQARKW